jgi:negative regulator of replication initiation
MDLGTTRGACNLEDRAGRAGKTRVLYASDLQTSLQNGTYATPRAELVTDSPIYLLHV